MKESILRDLISENISILEPGLTLISKEQYIPNELGTRGFIDLYAKDNIGNHVLIELKRSNASSREAIHEINKYVEGVKLHFGVKDNEIRVIIASTEWKELLVPFSRFVSDTSISVIGLAVDVTEEANIRTTAITPLDLNNGRLIAPWHTAHYYLNQDSLLNGITSIEESCAKKGIKDYILITFKGDNLFSSESQIRRLELLSGLSGNPLREDKIPHYKYIAYFAMQELSQEQCINSISCNKDALEEVNEIIEDLEESEKSCYLHETLTAMEPRSNEDDIDISYPAKFDKLLNSENLKIHSVKRYGKFERNNLLDDAAIIEEINGYDGVTGQRYKKKISINNQYHLKILKNEIEETLSTNLSWKYQILRVLNDIERDFPNAEITISIYNPETGVFTPYFCLTKEEGILYLPTYSIIVHDNNEDVQTYFGSLVESSQPKSFQEILNKYYFGKIEALILTVTWGARASEDTDIIEDLGLEYRSFRCDITQGQRTFFKYQSERWRECSPTNPFEAFASYIKNNETYLFEIVSEISSKDFGNVFIT